MPWCGQAEGRSLQHAHVRCTCPWTSTCACAMCSMTYPCAYLSLCWKLDTQIQAGVQIAQNSGGELPNVQERLAEASHACGWQAHAHAQYSLSGCGASPRIATQRSAIPTLVSITHRDSRLALGRGCASHQLKTTASIKPSKAQLARASTQPLHEQPLHAALQPVDATALNRKRRRLRIDLAFAVHDAIL